MQRAILGSLTALVLISAAPSAIPAEPADAIKYRHAVMDSLAGHMSALAGIARGKVDHPDHIKSHAHAIADAGQMLAVLFPEGSGVGETTHALPAIWEQPDKFAEAVAAAESATAAMKETAEKDPDNIGRAVASVGKACKGCHDNFRAEDDDH